LFALFTWLAESKPADQKTWIKHTNSFISQGKSLEFVAKTNLVQVIVPSQVLHHHESHCQLLSCTSGKCEEDRLPRLSQVKTSQMIVTITLPCAIYHNIILRITNQSWDILMLNKSYFWQSHISSHELWGKLCDFINFSMKYIWYLP
jgi:hypothetical protein